MAIARKEPWRMAMAHQEQSPEQRRWRAQGLTSLIETCERLRRA